MRKALLVGAIIGTTVLATSCDAFSDIRVEAGVSMPLGSIVLSDSSLFALAGDFSKELHVNPTTKVLYVQIADSLSLVTQQSFNEIFKFPSQSFSFDMPFAPVGVPGMMVDIPDNVELVESIELPGGERLDEVVFAMGSVNLAFANSQSADYTKLVVTIPEIVNAKTNKPLQIKVGTPIKITSDYVVRPTQNGANKNALTFKFSGKAPVVNKIQGTVVISLQNLQSAKGYFGRKEVLSPTITLTVSPEFEDFTGLIDYLYFEDPRLVFNILNQYNAPMIVQLTDLQISNQKLLFKDKYNSFFVPAKGQAIFVLDNAATTSGNQLSQLIGTNFKNFIVNVNAVMNPSQADISALKEPPANYVQPDLNSFSITDSLYGNYSVTIPFNAILQNARFEQEIDLDLSSMINEDMTITEFAFGFSGQNSMPLDIVINAYIKEGNVKVLLFDKPITIPASKTANINPATPSVIEGSEMLVAEVKRTALTKLFNSKKLYFELAASTKDAMVANPKAVKLFSPSQIDLDVIVGTVLDIQLTSKGQAPKGQVIQLTNQ